MEEPTDSTEAQLEQAHSDGTGSADESDEIFTPLRELRAIFAQCDAEVAEQDARWAAEDALQAEKDAVKQRLQDEEWGMLLREEQECEEQAKAEWEIRKVARSLTRRAQARARSPVCDTLGVPSIAYFNLLSK